MQRLQIRDFGTYRTMLATHTVDVGSGRAGIRWYELRRRKGFPWHKPGGHKPGADRPWTIHQQGDFAILGGDVYRGNEYPGAYNNRYFFANFGFGQGNIYTADAAGNYQQFGQTGQYQGLVDMQIGSDGHVWILSVVTGDLRRLVFDGADVQSNRDPVATASASLTAGVSPLTVSLDGQNSSDADGDALLFAWDFDSDGVVDAFGENVSHEFTNVGRTTTSLIVSDGRGGSDLSIVEVDVLDTDPADGNLALGRPAIQTGVVNGGVASRAVDGNVDSDFANESVTQTVQQRTPFWETDLGQSFNLGDVQVFSRDGDSLQNFWVFASDVPFTSTNLDPVRTDPNVTAIFFDGTANASELIPIDSSGRYVRVQLAGIDDTLSLAEVKIFEA